MAKGGITERVCRALLTDNVPYLITLFFAASAWTVVRTVDLLSSLPVIEYQTSVKSAAFADSQNEQISTIRLRNITLTTTFECLIFVVRADPPGGKYVFDKPAENRYIVRGTAVSSGAVTVETPYLTQIQLQRFVPGSDIEFGVTSFGNGMMNTKVQRCRGEDESPTTSAGGGLVGKQEKEQPFPVLLGHWWQVSFVEHETYWLWGMLLLWGISLLALLMYNAGRSNAGIPTESTDTEV